MEQEKLIAKIYNHNFKMSAELDPVYSQRKSMLFIEYKYRIHKSLYTEDSKRDIGDND